MDSRTQPAVVGPGATVREVARLMRERRTTAVCVMELTTTPGAHPKIAGIFTSKDVVLGASLLPVWTRTCAASSGS